MKKVQFFTKINTRNGFRGAQVKTWDCYQFINSDPRFKAKIKFHESSNWSEDVKWEKELVVNGGEFFKNPDLLVLKGGQDWLLYQKHIGTTNTPVISPIVNYRVLNEQHPSNQLLTLQAIRVCPNLDLMNKLKANSQVNGPVVCIPHGVALPSEIKPIQDRPIDLVIVALKNKETGKFIFDHFNNHFNINIKLIDQFLSHDEFIATLNDSKISLHLPQALESFYIPGLESLAGGTITLMPNCLGNYDYAQNIKGAFLCSYNTQDIIENTKALLTISAELLIEYSERAFIDAKAFSILNEKNQWLDLVEDIFKA